MSSNHVTQFGENSEKFYSNYSKRAWSILWTFFRDQEVSRSQHQQPSDPTALEIHACGQNMTIGSLTSYLRGLISQIQEKYLIVPLVNYFMKMIKWDENDALLIRLWNTSFWSIESSVFLWLPPYGTTTNVIFHLPWQDLLMSRSK